jgi:hypothetical protein
MHKKGDQPGIAEDGIGLPSKTISITAFLAVISDAKSDISYWLRKLTNYDHKSNSRVCVSQFG